MRKSKILGIALAAAMVSSIAVTAAFSASATVTTDGGIVDETVGITGSFAKWGNPDKETGEVIKDIEMTNNNGVWEGMIEIDSVTEDMLGEATTDAGPATGTIPRPGFEGKKCVQFKVRTNNAWDNSWGDYEAAYDRTNNSQTNCAVPAEVGQSLKIKVTLDTTKVAEGTALPADDGDAWTVWPVSYEVVGGSETPASEEPASEEPASEEPASEEPASEEPASEEPASEEPTSEKPADESSQDDTPVQTGDAASAAALVAVVLASLGTAVVMTKKASAKD